jgi:intergrase/recombinase
VRWPGFEPGPAAWQEWWNKYKEQFGEWLSQKVAAKTAKDYLRALERFFAKYKVHSYEDLQKALIKENYKRNLCKALRNFIHFLKEINVITREEHEQLKEIIKIKQTGKREIYISIEELREAYEYFKKHADVDTLLFFKLLVYSGARLSAVHDMLTNYDASKVIVFGKAAKYPLMGRKGTKAAFFVYFPAELVHELSQVNVKYDTINKKLHYGRVNPSTIRKWHTNFLIDYIDGYLVNFIHSRVSRSVLEKHYLDLMKKADTAYSRVVDKLKEVLEE